MVCTTKPTLHVPGIIINISYHIISYHIISYHIISYSLNDTIIYIYYIIYIALDATDPNFINYSHFLGIWFLDIRTLDTR